MKSPRARASLRIGEVSAMDRSHYESARTLIFSREQFERLGLRSTAHEPLHVYCTTCGIEIDPLRRKSWGPQRWWQCPRGCNGRVHCSATGQTSGRGRLLLTKLVLIHASVEKSRSEAGLPCAAGSVDYPTLPSAKGDNHGHQSQDDHTLAPRHRAQTRSARQNPGTTLPLTVSPAG